MGFRKMNAFRLLRYGIMNNKEDICNQIMLYFSKFIYDEIVNNAFKGDY